MHLWSAGFVVSRINQSADSLSFKLRTSLFLHQNLFSWRPWILLGYPLVHATSMSESSGTVEINHCSWQFLLGEKKKATYCLTFLWKFRQAEIINLVELFILDTLKKPARSLHERRPGSLKPYEQLHHWQVYEGCDKNIHSFQTVHDSYY